MKLEAFFRALKVADPSLFRALTRQGELPITYAWYVVANLWQYLDTDKPMPFTTEAELLEALRVYELSDDEDIAYIDSCEVQYMIAGDCQHTKAEVYAA